MSSAANHDPKKSTPAVCGVAVMWIVSPSVTHFWSGVVVVVWSSSVTVPCALCVAESPIVTLALNFATSRRSPVRTVRYSASV